MTSPPVSPLRTTPPPAPPPPARVTLGPQAWVVLLEAAAGVHLPSPFDAASGPRLDEAARELALRQLQESSLVPGSSGHLVRDLHPSILATLAVAAAPFVQIATAVRRGDEQDQGLLCLTGQLCAGLRRTLVDDGSDRLLVGPVELTTLLLEQAVDQVALLLGDLTSASGREAVTVDAATSVAAVRALESGREPVAKALLGGPVPQVLASLAGGVERVARVEVTSTVVTRVLLWLRAGDGWWRVQMRTDDVVLTPVDRDDVLVDLTSALSAALVDGADL